MIWCFTSGPVMSSRRTPRVGFIRTTGSLRQPIIFQLWTESAQKRFGWSTRISRTRALRWSQMYFARTACLSRCNLVLCRKTLGPHEREAPGNKHRHLLPAVAAVSERLRRLYQFEPPIPALADLGIEMITASDRDGEYRRDALSSWRASRRQIELMRTYPVEKICFEPFVLPSSADAP